MRQNAPSKADALQKWIDERPPAVRAVALRFPPDGCYRIHGRGHYIIRSYGEQADGAVSLTMAHGRDSFLPGVAVFGIDPEKLEACGCGKWKWPSSDQVRFMERRVEAAAARQ